MIEAGGDLNFAEETLGAQSDREFRAHDLDATGQSCLMSQAR